MDLSSSLVVFCCSSRVFLSSSSEIPFPVLCLALLVCFFTSCEKPRLLVHIADTLPRRLLVRVRSHNDSRIQCSRSVCLNQIYHSIKVEVSVCSYFIAPYSSSTTDTAAGLASESFMNTYGKCKQSSWNLMKSSDNTSVSIYNHGCSHVHFHDLCNANQCGIHTHFPLPALGFPSSVVSLLGTRPSECSSW